MNIINVPALVIGSGAAGLNAADELWARGVKAVIATDGVGLGTSFNTGSDKQTYYKLSLSGGDADSIADLAQTFFAGGAMHGDIAYALAALSARSFYKLVSIGVPFPHNAWGEYVGYRTDHDPRQRATSCGPLTSKFMGEKLAAVVRGKNIPIYEGLKLLSLLKAKGRVVGALFADAQNRLTAFAAPVTLLATGGAAGVYRDSVYPTQQTGAMGLALLAGAPGLNLDRWQYGLASTKVRWNLSGSYQQVLPKYVSTDADGGDAREFLLPWFKDERAMLDAVFLKGYQWPFDARKVPGSSVVDLAVYNETVQGRRVFLDFRANNLDRAFDFAAMGDEAAAYLRNCGCDQETPIARLERMNPDAVAFYRDRGIDIAAEMLEIAVCAQHINGGLAIDAWWRTPLPGLYAAGETAGAFGVYRPGGAALNETQCGSLRAAMHMAAHVADMPTPDLADSDVSAKAAEATAMRDGGGADDWDAHAILAGTRALMSDGASHIRRKADFAALKASIAADYARMQAAPQRGQPLAVCAEARDTLALAYAMISAMEAAEARFPDGGSVSTADMPAPDKLPVARVPQGEALAEMPALQTALTADGALCAQTQTVTPRPLPDGGGWFETVWKQYREGAVFGEA